MIDMDLEYSIVSEGARAARMEAKGADIDHPASAYLHMQSWSSLENPANLTVSFDYYIDVIANPQLGDRLELYIPFNGYYVHYFIGSDTSIANTSTHAYYELDTGPLHSWNTFERNVTQDYLDVFGNFGFNFRLDRFAFYVNSYDLEYTRAYIDDVNFVNDTDIKVGGLVNSGNFETGYSGSWWWGFVYDAGLGDISQSTTRVEGDWSLNMTVNAVGDTGYSKLTKNYDTFIKAIIDSSTGGAII